MNLFKKTPEEPEEVIIAKVRVSKTGQKLVTIPKKSSIEDGEHVRIIKLNK